MDNNKSNIFLIYGNDDYQLKLLQNKILKQINDKDKNEKIIFDLQTTQFSSIFNDFWIDSWISEKRIFILDNFHLLIKKEKNNIKYLLKLLTNNNFFILIYRNDKLILNNNFKKFTEKIIIKKTFEVNPKFIEKFIINYVKQKNGTITNESLIYITDNSPYSLNIIQNELNKILNISLNITIDLVRQNLTKYVIGDIFKLINAILNKDLNKFKKNYFDIKNFSSIENQVIPLLFENIRLMKVMKLLSNSLDRNKISDKLNINLFRFNLLYKLSLVYSNEQLEEISEIIYNYEINKTKVLYSKDYFHFILLKIYKVGVGFGFKKII